MVFRAPITSPAAWLGPEIQDDDGWILRVDDAANREIEAALRHAQARGVSIPFDADQLPLPGFAEVLDTVPDRLEEGVGFVLVRGLEHERYSDAEAELVYWAIARHLGTLISQNARGHLLGHVRDEGRSLSDPTARGYQTAERLDFHTDQLPVDILGLYCLRTARRGGASKLVSGLTVHNVLQDERPDLLEVLYEPFNVDWRDEEPDGETPWYVTPVYGEADGKVSIRVVTSHFYESVSRFSPELGLTPTQREALAAIQEIANRPELRLSMDFQPGDIQLLNNHVVLHARDSYEDHEEPERKRHLLRAWIALPEHRQRTLSPGLEDRRRFVRAGGFATRAA